MIDLDAATGLPEVPEGYFWRVKWREPGQYDRGPSVRVQLRESKPRRLAPNHSRVLGFKEYTCIDSDTKAWTADGYWYHPLLTEEQLGPFVRNMADIVLKEHQRYIDLAQANVALRNKLGTLSGDYPPKKLEA